MSDPTGLVSISLGWVVLDRPDQSGVYIAKDLAGGWAYLVADQDGDTRYRGQGPCAGGVDVALRCGFLSAVACVPEYLTMRVLVDSRQAHRAMVRLALQDLRVAAAIGGRQVSVMTRPLERPALLVQAAAERAASAALRTRERDEWHGAQALAEATTEIGHGGAGIKKVRESGWRARQDAARAAGVPVRPVQALLPAPAELGRLSPLQRLIGPLLGGARTSLEAAGVIAVRPKAARSRLLSDWLSDLDGRVETVRTGLGNVGR